MDFHDCLNARKVFFQASYCHRPVLNSVQSRAAGYNIGNGCVTHYLKFPLFGEDYCGIRGDIRIPRLKDAVAAGPRGQLALRFFCWWTYVKWSWTKSLSTAGFGGSQQCFAAPSNGRKASDKKRLLGNFPPHNCIYPATGAHPSIHSFVRSTFACISGGCLL